MILEFRRSCVPVPPYYQVSSLRNYGSVEVGPAPVFVVFVGPGPSVSPFYRVPLLDKLFCVSLELASVLLLSLLKMTGPIMPPSS